MNEVVCERRGGMGLLTLNRAKALNALSLEMIRAMTRVLRDWANDPQVQAVAVRGMGRDGPFGVFCAGGDIRFFHQAALAGDPRLEDFFTEEYALNHLVHRYPKPYVTFLDGVVMGGGMGIAGHGGANSLRLVTRGTKMAMPETNIGLFPDVGGGWFLARCPGRLGEYLALTGEVVGGPEACTAGLADRLLDAGDLPTLWDALAQNPRAALDRLRQDPVGVRPESALDADRAQIDDAFSQPDVAAILGRLDAMPGDFASRTAQVLRKRSPLMLHVVLEQVRRARGMSLADELRLERDMVRHCFQLRPGAASETVEGIRALAIDKDHAPRWNPGRIEDVTQDMVAAFFDSPWPAHAHPLRDL